MLLTLLVLLAVCIPKVGMRDSRSIDIERLECAKRATRALLENPFERVIVSLGSVVVTRQQGDRLFTTVYAVFGIRYAELEVTCLNGEGGARRIWSLVGGT